MKCRDCKIRGSDYLTTYSQQGMFRFDYCNFDPSAPRVVDAEVERSCPNAELVEPEVVK